MRFNPPPNWPAAPEGWEPAPGWVPDPSWPAPPEGWQLWLPDETPTTVGATPAPSSAQPVAADPFLAGYGTPTPSYGAAIPVYGAATPGYGPPPMSAGFGSADPANDEIAALRKNAARAFLFGVGAVVVASVVTLASVGSSHGVIMYGALAFGALSIFRGIKSYNASRRLGGAAIGGGVKALAVLGLVACLVLGAATIGKVVETKSLTASVGSCWKVDGADAVLVSCSSDHAYRASAVVSSETDCPDTATAWVEGDAGKVVCLDEE
ncbi:hypothetical protein [Cellulomonas composti]|uniref:Uncharacterized protein n=1 Tax=Cellulomonas composti TaxID=266130 RepID=A0A511J797_9CELL|nr:hypothetical protein [Cellulomonas composti]GEL93861.1 hypothetical protein CCO02nite_05190 [Cellulomonas composti]